MLANELQAHHRRSGECVEAGDLVRLGLVEDLPLDPWGEAYFAVWMKTDEGVTLRVSSAGPDMVAYTEDDIDSSPNR